MAEQNDERPLLAVAHVSVDVSDLKKASDYYVKLGMRAVHLGETISVLELRGGTHLVVRPTEQSIVAGTKAPFDLMVDDLEAVRTKWGTEGLAPSDVKSGQVHNSFRITDPSGYEITIFSPHTSGRPV
jgi:catechol 2,3-dioxygenase-like lactoylglutathione lyase family enzyme